MASSFAVDAHAATFVVNSTVDAVDALPGDGSCDDGTGSCTLRAAIDETNALTGTDEIVLPAGLYPIELEGSREDGNATGDFDISGAVTITGVDRDSTIIDAEQLDRIFDISAGSKVTLNSLSVINGQGPEFTNAEYYMGGALFSEDSEVILNDCSFENNKAASTSSFIQGSPGGALYVKNGPLSITNSHFENNSGGDGKSYGGHAGAVQKSGTGDLTVTNSTFNNNTTGSSPIRGANGGALFNNSSDGAIVTITNNTFSSNKVGYSNSGFSGYGAAYYEDSYDATLIISNNTFENNGVGSNGESHSSTYGGAIYLEADETDITISNNTFSGNNATNAGAIYNEAWKSPVLFSNNTFVNNSAVKYVGGAIYEVAYETTTQYINNTFSGNSADAGGALYVYGDGGTVSFLHNTFVNNSLLSDGQGSGIYFNTTDGMLISNSIFANTSDNVYIYQGAALSGSGNLSTDLTLESATLVTTEELNLGELQDNGGTTETYELQDGSIAINATTCLTEVTDDQRGVKRPIDGACDAGSFEATILSGTYEIRNIKSDLCVDVSAASYDYGANVQQWDCNNTDAQQWTITYIEDDYYEIQNVNSDLLLDVAWGGQDSNVQQWGDTDGAGQRWKITLGDNNSYTLSPQSDDTECLDIEAASTSSGANVQSYTCNDSSAQLFTLTSVD